MKTAGVVPAKRCELRNAWQHACRLILAREPVASRAVHGAAIDLGGNAGRRRKP